ncbi:hypothetical protein JCM15519_03360 [Fundidesulfovibrio butyratiphilus]
MNAIIEGLRQSLPPVFGRRAVEEHTGGLLPAGTLRNLDSQGQGPEGVCYMGRHLVYEREKFLAWFEARLTATPASRPVRPRKRAGK